MTDDGFDLYTLGHSVHGETAFLELLGSQRIDAVADLRSVPYSRRQPHFNRDELPRWLRPAGIRYVHLGDVLGGRPRPELIDAEGRADYRAMAMDAAFGQGLDRVVAGAGRFRVALVCSEGAPEECHRCLLVGRALADRGLRIGHILRDRTVIDQDQVIETLCRRHAGRIADAPDPVDAAYAAQARRFAWRRPGHGRDDIGPTP